MAGPKALWLLPIVLAVVAGTGSGRPAFATDFDTEGALSGWLYGLDGTVSTETVTAGFPVEASFSDLAGYRDFAIAGHIETKIPKSLLLADVMYVNLSANRDVEGSSGTTRGSLNFTQWIIEGGAGYRLTDRFDLLGVGRYYIMESGTTLGGELLTDTVKNWMDVFLGLRYSTEFGRWRASVRGDIGAGGSDLAWFGNARLGYRVSERVTFGVGYRILSIDYEPSPAEQYFRYDVVQDGLGLVVELD